MTGIPGSANNSYSSPSVQDFVEISKNACSSDKIIWSENDSGKMQLMLAKEKFKDYALSFFRNFPLLKNTDAVKQAVANIESLDIKSKLAMVLFANALSKCYKNDVTTAAISPYIGRNKITALNSNNIKKIQGSAESYHGVGAARNYSRKATINLWPYERMDKGGHASITLKNKDAKQSEHLSWWPDNDYQKDVNTESIATIARNIDAVSPLKTKLYSNFINKFGGSLTSYKVDKDYEIGSADKKMASGEKARRIINNRIINGSWVLERSPPKNNEQRKVLQEEIDKLYEQAKENPASAKGIRRMAWDLQLLHDSSYVPQSAQVKDKKGKWGTVAQKINFPLVGPNSVNKGGTQKSSKFVMFGLSEAATFAYTKNAKDNAKAYLNLREAQDDFNDPGLNELDAEKEYLGKIMEEVKNLEISVSKSVIRKNNIQKNIESYNKQIAELRTEGRKPGGQDLLVVKAKLKNAKDNLKGIIAVENELLAAQKNLKNTFEGRLKAAQDQAKLAGNEIGYLFASNNNNCASMAINVLRAGGAENYVPLPKMTSFGMEVISPDEQFSNYAKAVQTEIDQLNGKADFVLSELDKRAPISEMELVSRQEMEEFKNVYESESGTLSPSDKAYFSAAINIISDNFPVDTDDMNSLNMKTKKMIVAAEELLKKTNANGKSSFAEKEINTFLHKTVNLHKQKITEWTCL